MLESRDQADGWDTAVPIAFGDPSEPVRFVPGLSADGAEITGVNTDSLSAATQLVVDTRNSRYRIRVTEGRGWNALVQGGRYFAQETEARIGWIVLGLGLELSVGGKRVVTSRVRSIHVERL